MQFGPTETQRLLKNSAREFFPAECPMSEVRRLMEIDGAHDSRLWQKLAENGWSGIIFDERDGGMGLGLVEMAMAAEEMGRVLLPGPYFSTVFLAGAMLKCIPQEHSRLKPICEGRERATVALLEDNARWDADGVRMELENGRITGRKLFVPDAATADSLLCVVRCGLGLAIVLAHRGDGVSVRPMPAIDRTRHLYCVDFDGAEIELLTAGEDAQLALDGALDIATVALTAEMVGGMQRVTEVAVEYCKTRKQFGKPIGRASCRERV